MDMRAALAIVLALLPIAGQAAAPLAPDAAVSLLDRARLWSDRNRPQLARETLEKLFRIAPDHPDGLAALALVELRAERPAMARAALDRLRRAQPAHPAIPRIEARLRLGGADREKLALARQLAQQSRQDGRRDVRPKALAAYRALFPGGRPDGDLALEYWALMADDWNQWEAARKGLTDLARQNPDNLRYRFALAEHEISRLPVNRRALQTVIEMTQLPEYERQARAAWRRAMQRLDASAEHVRLLEDYLRREPNDSALQDKLKTFQVAEAARQRLLADPAYRARMEGIALLEKDRPEEAEPLLARALLDRPDDADVAGGLGLLRLRQGHHTQALALFRQALRQASDQSGKWKALESAAIYWGLLREAGDARSGGDYRLAEDKLAEALVIDPREPQARLVLARVQSDSQRPDLAEANYRRVLELDTANRTALAELLDLLVRNGRRGEAHAMLDGLAAAQRAALGRDLDSIRAGLLRADADVLVADHRLGEAASLLEHAVALDPDAAWLCHDLGRVRLALGDSAAAFAPLERLLARRPDDGAALHALALLQSAAAQGGKALLTLERLAPDRRDEKLTRFQRQMWTEVHIDRTRQAIAGGRIEHARQLLEDAVRMLGDDADLLPRLAQAWNELGEPRRGLALFARLRAAGRSLSADLRLTEAGILADMGQVDAVRGTLAELVGPSADQRAQVTAIHERAVLQSVRRQVAEGGRDLALASLSSALSELGERPALLREQARIETRRGDATGSAQLLRRALALAPGDSGLRLDLAEALIASGQPRQAVADIDRWLAVAAASEEHEERLADGLRLGRTLLAGSGDIGALMMAQVKALRSTGRHADADLGLRRLLASADSLPPRERTELAETLVDRGWLDSARSLVDTLLSVVSQQSRVLLLNARLVRAEGREREALGWLQRGYERELSEQTASGEVRLSTLTPQGVSDAGKTDLALAGPVAAARADDARSTTGSYGLRQLAKRIDDDAHWLSAGADQRQRTGTPGISRYHSDEIFLEGTVPAANGDRWLARADAVRLNAGSLDPTSTRLGAMALCGVVGPACSTTAPQSAEGVGIAVGWQRHDLRADLGLTPRNFLVANWVGGLADKGDLGMFSWSAELSRRAVAGSLLSWAGTRDPYTGQTWGGVVTSGLRLGLSNDKGGAFGVWSSLGWHRLTGQNVVANQRRQLMAGGYWRAINDDDRLLSIGLTGIYMTHLRNAGEYTFGHGGYYSPEWYRSLTLPITGAIRFARFSYSVRYAESRSRSFTDAATYFPTDTVLQASAAAAGINATHSASDSDPPTSKGKSLHLGMEYQVAPQLFLGGRLEIERSPDYAPDRLMIYLRYNLDRPGAQAVKLSPEPLLPYSQF